MALETGVGSCPWQSVLVLLNEGLGGGGGGGCQEDLGLGTPVNWER